MIELANRIYNAYPDATTIGVVGAILLIAAWLCWCLRLNGQDFVRESQRLEKLSRAWDEAADAETKRAIENAMDEKRYRGLP